MYVQNRGPHRALGKMTPKEAFTRVKPEIGHLRTFGCLVYSQVHKIKKTKLEPTTDKGILVGYSEPSKAYKIYIPLLRKVVARRDIIFEEDIPFRRSHGSDAKVKE